MKNRNQNPNYAYDKVIYLILEIKIKEKLNATQNRMKKRRSVCIVYEI